MNVFWVTPKFILNLNSELDAARPLANANRRVAQA
jgi:hypothetical protein